ncbi:MAG: hypothetical protein GTO53_05925 [Planctomycetales bacterium]|nr:hypothetical protein [Planctomycetales bacterium]NIM08682.1 hypothetical protein [Planctomycetales bacterium]NIN08156.1 hypothetical protein [Planctomycetales bacterium]NIN77283.1 hypothetical protein [Planctomycetales bacterium]NIO34467.1 hypothetical protein [Planctomycetales bacterium]
MADHCFVDIHCHLLPGIDDGARDWDESLAMAELAVADGVQTILCTPHQLGSYRQNTAADVRQRVRQLDALLRERQIPLNVLPGADVRIEPDLVAELQADRVLTLGDQGRHVLLELPHDLYLPLDPLVEALRGVGLQSILSHPERNQGILRQPSLLTQLVSAGCLMQVTAGSLLGTFGPSVQQFSQKILQEGLCHFLATDAHGATARRPRLQAAFRRATQLVGTEYARRICCENPGRVASGKSVAAGVQQGARPGLRGWWGLRRAG